MANNKPFFTLLWVITLTIAGVFVLVGISLVPHFADIGLAATIMLYIFMGYATIAGGGFLAYKLWQWWNYRNLITHGDVVTYRVGPKEFEHLNAKHEQAKVPPLPQVTFKELPSGDPSWAAVLDLRHDGKGMHSIAKELKVPYNRVRQFLNQVEGNSDET